MIRWILAATLALAGTKALAASKKTTSKGKPSRTKCTLEMAVNKGQGYVTDEGCCNGRGYCEDLKKPLKEIACPLATRGGSGILTEEGCCKGDYCEDPGIACEIHSPGDSEIQGYECCLRDAKVAECRKLTRPGKCVTAKAGQDKEECRDASNEFDCTLGTTYKVCAWEPYRKSPNGSSTSQDTESH